MTRPITDLINFHSGFPVAVLGGSPSLPEDVEKLPPNCILIAANHHASLLGIEVDYLVYKDDPRKQKPIRDVLDNHRGKVISKRENETDFIINVAHFDRGFTGTLCCWLACYMTDQEVILCGIDCYSGGKPYFHDQMLTWRGTPDRYLQQWELAWGKVAHIPGCPNPERISAMSGPLTKVFKEYK